MGKVRKLGIVAAGIFSVAGLASPASATLVLCGISDNDPGDLDGSAGIIQTTCDLGTGSFTGTAQEFVGPNFDVIHIIGTLTGEGSLVAWNDYTIGPWLGDATETVSMSGTFTLGPSRTPGFIQGATTATTFGNNSATITIIEPVGPFLAGSVRYGEALGLGVMTAAIIFDAVDGSFSLPASGVFTLSASPITEPSTWVMMIAGLVGVGGLARSQRRPSPVPA